MKISEDPFLKYLTFPISSLPGAGPRTRALLKHLVGESVSDLLYHFPLKIMERVYFPTIKEFLRSVSILKEDSMVTLIVRIEGYDASARRGGPLRVHTTDTTGSFDILFFNSNLNYIKKKLVLGSEVLVSGKPVFYGGKFQISHPDYIGPISSLPDFKGPSPVYPLTAGLSTKVVGHVAQTALKLIPNIAEWLDPLLLKQNQWPSWKEALSLLHNPKSSHDLSPTSFSRQRLAYDEMLAQQLMLLMSRHHTFKTQGRSFTGSQKLIQHFLELLPFDLTACQRRVFKEITHDLSSKNRMLRLLQGDVGSGKTIVAFLSALHVLESNAQVAILAPTEILAGQHFITLSPWAKELGISIELLSRQYSQKKKGKDIKEALSMGEISLIVGTHALLEDDVTFNDLGLVIVDEQHRFGVEQRLKLLKKGYKADILVMSATPIPRTLQLVSFGDMDLSTLHEKPKNRKSITTRVLPLERIGEVIQAISRILEQRQQVYWVCPLVKESEVLDLTAAQERFLSLQKAFGIEDIALLHGKMKPAEKEQIMATFAQGHIKILVSTTVVEVGIDVTNATLMVVEHAERFGLSQLHQLRGRVGRGVNPSTCLLLYAHPLSDIARRRLNIIRETEDGFKIAEEDLKIRGAGDLLGVHQSGYDIYKCADLYEHQHLLILAQQEARLIFEKDPHLLSERGQNLRHLLYIFNRTEATHYLMAG